MPELLRGFVDKNIYDLGLHEKTFVLTNTVCVRVPGGWVYFKVSPHGHQAKELRAECGTFVPYDKEFKPK